MPVSKVKSKFGIKKKKSLKYGKGFDNLLGVTHSVKDKNKICFKKNSFGSLEDCLGFYL